MFFATAVSPPARRRAFPERTRDFCRRGAGHDELGRDGVGRSGRGQHGLQSGRRLLLGVGLLASLCVVVGCDAWKNGDEAPAPDAAPAEPARVVPLRVLSFGSPELNERIEAAWSAVDDQPLTISAQTADEGADPVDLDLATKRTDVILFHNWQMGDLQDRGALAPLPQSFLESPRIDADSLLDALASDSLRWGGEAYGLPLGTPVPALWVNPQVELPPLGSWAEFEAAVAALPDGAAAEPLAEGWAGRSFLSRAATLTGGTWLFERQSFKPVLSEPPYVRALEQMVAAREKYPKTLLRPEEIWARLASGELQIGITWPDRTPDAADAPHGDASSEGGSGAIPRLIGYPRGGEIFIDSWRPAGGVPTQFAVPPVGLTVGISQSCRQTAAARAFVGWLASRDGLPTIRGPSAEILPNRRSASEAEASETGPMVTLAMDPARRAYDEYVVSVLSGGQIRPSLRLPGAAEYAAALDAGVRAALSGESEPLDALRQVEREWESITDRMGRREQANAWRQSQGMRGR